MFFWCPQEPKPAGGACPKGDDTVSCAAPARGGSGGGADSHDAGGIGPCAQDYDRNTSDPTTCGTGGGSPRVAWTGRVCCFVLCGVLEFFLFGFLECFLLGGFVWFVFTAIVHPHCYCKKSLETKAKPALSFSFLFFVPNSVSPRVSKTDGAPPRLRLDGLVFGRPRPQRREEVVHVPKIITQTRTQHQHVEQTVEVGGAGGAWCLF